VQRAVAIFARQRNLPSAYFLIRIEDFVQMGFMQRLSIERRSSLPFVACREINTENDPEVFEIEIRGQFLLDARKRPGRKTKTFVLACFSSLCHDLLFMRRRQRIEDHSIETSQKI
jgi:hypothetical protein